MFDIERRKETKRREIKQEILVGLYAFLTSGKFPQGYWQRKFMDIQKKENYYWMNRRALEDTVVEPKPSL